MHFFSGSILFLLLLSSSSLLKTSVHAEKEQDETIDTEEEDDGNVADEGVVEDDDDDEAEVEEDSEGDATDASTTEQEPEPLKPHPDTESGVIFSSGQEVELIAGKIFTSYLHFANTGSKNFIITSISGSFRYPQDFSYVIQNFTDLALNKMIDAGKEGSFMYRFMPAELAAGRPFGLVLSLNYKDTENNLYQDAVFNKTVTVLENEEGVDAETFFMYVILAAIIGLIVFAAYHLISTKSKRGRRHMPSSIPAEMGTGENNVDYSWIPQETLKSMNKGSPSPKRSPRKRTSKRSPASETE